MSDWRAFGAYHIDTMGLFGGVFTTGAVGNLAREIAFATVALGLGHALARGSRKGSGSALR
jgi:hypothetical protein